jgi:DNA repair protein SbcC/Rad50
MRPNELWMEGLAAFRQPQAIDFRTLDDLFAIVGPTGAGKTTILDGISLALFGELPRANQHQRKDFITLGASEAKVRLDFTAGGVEYRVARRLPRTRSQMLSLEVRNGSGWVPDPEVLDGSVADVNRRIEQILGFDYDAFTKAVLLPQGDFAQFLRGAAEERRKLLSRLLDCEKYEKAGAIARDRAKEHDREVRVRTEMLERDWSDATPERLTAFVEESADLRTREADLRLHLAEAEAASSRVAELRGRAAALNARESRLGEAAAEAGRIREAYASLADEERASAQRVEKAEEQLAAAQAACSAAEETLRKAIGEGGDEAALARLQSAAEALAESERELAPLADRRVEAEQQLEEARTRLAQAREEQQVASTAEAAAREALETAQQSVAGIREAVRTGTERAGAEADRADARTAVAGAGPALEVAREGRVAAERALAEAEQTRDAVQVAHSAHALREALEEGEPCPVCEQVVTQLPGPVPGQSAVQAAARAVNEAKRVRDRAAEAEREADLAAARAQTALEQAEARVATLPPAVPAPAPDALPTAEQTEREARRVLEDARRACKAADQKVTKLVGAEATAAAAPVAIDEQRTRLEERAARARSTLASAYGEETGDRAVERITAAQEQLRALRQDEKDRRKEVADRTTDLSEATRARGTHEAASRGLVERLIALRSRMADELETRAQGYEDESHAEQAAAIAAFCGVRCDELMAEAVDAEAQAADIEAAVARRFAEINLDVPAAGEGDAEQSALMRALAALKRWIQATGEAAAQAEGSAATLRRRIEQRAEHEAQIAELSATEARYRRLAGELRSDRFIKFVLEESFQELALRASEELNRVSGGRYSLKASGYDFQVIDHANADECRSVVTLSGGESFLASLSLALAFAGSIRDLAGDALGARLESVFIDEGFGSLDPDVLDIVADGLERVQEDRRQVGIITHVPSLASRIPSGLRVEPGPGGSMVHAR